MKVLIRGARDIASGIALQAAPGRDAGGHD